MTSLAKYSLLLCLAVIVSSCHILDSPYEKSARVISISEEIYVQTYIYHASYKHTYDEVSKWEVYQVSVEREDGVATFGYLPVSLKDEIVVGGTVRRETPSCAKRITQYRDALGKWHDIDWDKYCSKESASCDPSLSETHTWTIKNR